MGIRKKVYLEYIHVSCVPHGDAQRRANRDKAKQLVYIITFTCKIRLSCSHCRKAKTIEHFWRGELSWYERAKFGRKTSSLTAQSNFGGPTIDQRRFRKVMNYPQCCDARVLMWRCGKAVFQKYFPEETGSLQCAITPKTRGKFELHSKKLTRVSP